MRRLYSCCGCCDLRTGIIIIGICGFLFTILGIIVHTVFLDHIEEEDTRDHLKIMILYSYIYAVLNVLLLYGTIRENKYFLLPWIAYVGFGLGITTLFCFIFMFFIAGLTSGTIISVSLWYVWFCVVSFYMDLNQPTTTVVTIGGYPGVAQGALMASSMVSYESQRAAYSQEVV